MTSSAAVGILTWHGEETTRSCLRSLLGDGAWSGPTVVIDNGSGTGEGERLAKEFGVAFVSLPTNGGVPSGYNAAIRWAVDHGATHVLLVNNDVEFLDRSTMTRLAALAAPNVAAVGPIIRTRDGTIWSAGTRIRRWIGHAERMRQPRGAEPYSVDALDGSCLLVSVEAACRIGGLAPEYFLYWEETDWCERARKAGLQLLVDPATSVTHLGGGSGDLRQTRRYALRNSLLFIRRNTHGVAGLTAAAGWLFARAPIFAVRRLREGATGGAVLSDLRWAIGWHLRDIARLGWRRLADGPRLCG